MQLSVFTVLLLFLSARQTHAAVAWRTVGCDNWAAGDINSIWDNADLMATNAKAQAALVPNTPGFSSKTPARIAGANANFMFGISWSTAFGTDAAGLATMQQVSTAYDGIHNGLQGNLPNLDTNNAILFCGGNGLTFGIPPGYSGSNVWYATISTPVVPAPVPQTVPPAATTEYIILSYTATRIGSNGWPHPCTEDQVPAYAREAYAAKTFTASQIAGTPPIVTDFTAIILCPPAGETATLGLGYAPLGTRTTPDDSKSVAGALLHEMAHVYGHSIGEAWADNDNYYFNKCLNLAKSNPAGALTNPDNYRIFAEMSMSPATKWLAPPPPPST